MYSTIVLRNKDSKGNGTIYVQYAYNASSIKRIRTGIKVNEKFFDKAGQKIRKGGTSDVDADNRTINGIKSNVDNIIRKHLEAKGVKPTVKHLTQEYEKLNDTQHEKRLVDYVSEFIAAKKGINANANTVKGYSNLKDNLSDYETKYKVRVDFDDVNTMSFFNDYCNFLVTDKKYYNATIKKRLGVLKTILNHYFKMGLIKNTQYQQFTFTGPVARNQEVITLNAEDLEELKKLDLSENKRLEKTRDLFIIECWTGLRYVDLMGISKRDFKNKRLKRFIEKTNSWESIPLFDEAEAVLVKYQYEIKRISNAKYNEYLKEVCALVPKFQEEITKIHFCGNEKIEVTKKKCDWITSHTARRTFATLMMDLDVNYKQIMKWTGHTTMRSFEVYLNGKQGEDAQVKKVMANYKQEVEKLKQNSDSIESQSS